LSEIINNKYGSEGLLIDRFITKTELSRIKTDKSRLFANMSLLDKEIPVPTLSENFKLKKEMNALLIEAHEKTKKLLAAMRKKNTQSNASGGSFAC
jgi:flagellar biosynthesis/type III secretory pathway chaperone